MGALFFLVTVETERESGKFAGRDEISEAISNVIQDAESNADLSSLGADGDSVYSITSFDIEELEKKDRKAVYDEYAALVVEQLPGDAEMRDTIKKLKAEIKSLETQVEKQKGKVADLLAERSNDKTRIWQKDGKGISALDEDAPRTYLKDGIYDAVEFAYGDKWDQRFEVTLTPEGYLHVRGQDMGSNFTIRPIHSSEVEFRMEPRR